MNLKLAVALSSTESGCQVGFLDSDEAAQVNYSSVMIQYGIRARAGDLVAVDLGTPTFRLVYVWSLVEVTLVEANSAYYLDLSGAEQSLAIPEAYKGKIISGMSIFTDGQVLADWAEKGRPVHPARIAQIIFPRIEAMYKPFDSPYLGMIDRFTQGQRDDVTPLFADHSAFAQLVKDLADHFDDIEIDYIVGIDALGFILGTALAWHFKLGFIPARKGGKLPVETFSTTFVDYSGQSKTLEMRADALSPGARVLIADDWIETGAQVKAVIELVEQQGGKVVGIAAINIDDNPVTALLKANYNAFSP